MVSTPNNTLSIVIVNWNSCAYLRNCLKSIYDTAGDMTFEVIVVDNASFDGSKAMVAEEFPEVRFIQSDTNLGFAKANNLGYEHSSGMSLLFLNPDTQVLAGSILKLETALLSVPTAGIVGPRLLNQDGSLQTSCIQAFPSILNQLLDIAVLRDWFPSASLWGAHALFESGSEPIAVDSVSGACLMIRRSTFESVNRFCTDYFMYSEDLDLCFKVAKKGCKSYYCSDARVIHLGGRSSGATNNGSFSVVMMKESLRKFFAMRRSNVHAAVFQSIMALVAVLRLTVLASVFVGTLGMYRKNAVRAALCKWFKVLRWSGGFEGWARGTK